MTKHDGVTLLNIIPTDNELKAAGESMTISVAPYNPPIVDEYVCCCEVDGKKTTILVVKSNGDIILEGKTIANTMDIMKRIKQEAKR